VQEIGYPLMVKAAAGGGGRGMRVVRRADELNDALESASREAEAAFGDGRIFIEKLIEGGRHIEAQVFGDHTGRIVFLGERECSIQRRHQKVIEECPSPAVDDALRARIADAAVKAGEAVSYTNAGTVEFLLAPDRSFYFLEMNTRLQVEHPVTEEVLGIDLVEWQLKVAAGECVPPVPKSTGHAIEFRLYAEDPARNFSPAPGLVERLELPPAARWDGGYEVGDDIPLDYDSLLGKLIVNGQDREAALSNSRRALGGAVIQGPATNLPLLRWVVAVPDFAEGVFDVDWLERRLTESTAAVLEPPTEAFLSAAAWDITAPGKGFSAWRPAGTRGLLAYSIQGHVCDVWYESARFGQWKLTAHESSWSLSDVELLAGEVSFRLDGKRVAAAVAEDQEVLTVDWNGNRYAVEHRRLRRGGVHSSASGEGLVVRAPMPGVIARILVVRGASVLSGQTVAILEAMKMEHQLNSLADGVVAEILVSEGERVEEGAVILSLAAQGPESESESASPG
jgi:3-methylcrotonyl-CoA carboxylase alpha subunit